MWRKAKIKVPPFNGLEVWCQDDRPIFKRVTNKATGKAADQFVVPIAVIDPTTDKVQYMALNDLELGPEYSNKPEFLTLQQLSERAQWQLLKNEKGGGH